MTRACAAVAVAAAIALGVFAAVRGTWAVGGSDSSCYGLMADAFAHGRLQPASPLAIEAPWPNAPTTFAPGGFRPGLEPGTAMPICAPGMSVLMAPLDVLFGRDAIFWLTPIAAAGLVLAAYQLATALAGPMAGAAAALLTATSPIVLYQAVQPMNDIVTAALWLGAFAAVGRPFVCGVLIGVAILVRPNLAPLAVVPAAMSLVEYGLNRSTWRSLGVMVAASLPGAVVLLALNRALYGGMLSSGYGAASALFSASHLSTNLQNYGRAAFQTQHIVPAMGLLAPLVLTGRKRWSGLVLAAGAAINVAIYLLYEPFPEWWYLRFLIPALVVLFVLASAGMAEVLNRASMRGVLPIIAFIIGLWCLREAGQRQVLRLQAMEGRYRAAGAVVRNELPANAVLITEWQSGSVRFHAGKEVVLWESFDPAWLDRGIAWLRSKGYRPYLMFERREERDFRDRFGESSAIGRLDWPPRFDLNRQVRIYDPSDRARFLAGESYITDNR